MLKSFCGRCCSQTWRGLRAKLPSRNMVKIYLLLFMNMFSNSFAITMLFPYLPFLMEFLIPRLQEDEKNVGKYIGYVAGSMYIGRLFGSYFWGVLSDRKGRKPVLIISCICMALCTLLFGFSVNFAMAVAARFLMGCANGMVSTTKAVVSEISDDSNQAFGIAVVATAWGSGFIIGPAVAGAVADPIVQYNLTITDPFLHGFLTRFPFSLPPFVSVLLFALTSTLTFLFLPETLGLKKSRKRSEIDEMELAAFRSRLGHTDGVDHHPQDSSQTSLCEEEEGTDETRLMGGEESDNSENRTSNLFISNRTAITVNGTVTVDLSAEEGEEMGEEGGGEEAMQVMEEGEEEKMAEKGGREQWMVEGEKMAEKRGGEEAKQVMEERDGEREESQQGGREGGEGEVELSVEEEEEELEAVTVQSKRCRCLPIVLSAVKNSLLDLKLFLCDCASLKSLLIYCIFSFGVIGFTEIFSLWAYTQPHFGGLGFSLHEISICLTIVGVLMLPVNLLAFPLLEKRLQAIKTYYLVAIIITALVLTLPHIHYLVSHKLVLWCVLVTLSFAINGLAIVGFSANFMFINNSVTLDKLGSVNGVAVMMTSVTRAIAPVVCGSLFSVSLSDATLAFGFPVNYNLVFVVLSIVFMTTVFMVACLPVSINKQKIIEDL